MKLILVTVLSLLIILIAILLTFNIFPDSLAQKQSGPTKTVTAGTGDIFRVGVTLIGVNHETGNVFTFVKVDRVTTARYFNASQDDLKDHDGIVDSVLSFPNRTVSTGANFTACNVILKDLAMSCKSGINVPQRTEIIQFVLPTFKSTAK